VNAHPAQRRRRGQARLRYAAAALLALLVHGLAGLLVVLTGSLSGERPAPRPQVQKAPLPPVAMRPLTSDQWQKNRGPVPPSPEQPRVAEAKPPPPRPPEPPKPEQRPKGQVVDVAPGNREEDPNAKYLAESSNRAKKETRSKETTPDYRNAMPRRTQPTPSEGTGTTESRQQVAGNDGLGADDRPLKEPTAEKKRALEIPDVKAKQEVALDRSRTKDGPGAEVSNQPESLAVRGNSKRLNVSPGAPGSTEESSAGRVGKPGPVNLMPSAAVTDRITGAAPNDHLKDVEEGDGTYLSTREWKYASFFNRVKQSVGMQWDPSVALRQRDPTGNAYTGRDRYTLLSVKLGPDGRIREVAVEKSCGLDFLDLEAVRSFERAQPFPNPPAGLLDGDSQVKFSFGFFLDMGGGPRMRLFRQAN
jgi:TonB family protein